MLSEDGANFVAVSFWYFADTPVVTIYRAEGQRSLDGEAFNVSRHKLQKTVSHRLWLTNEQQPYAFVGADQLRVVTIDNRSHLIDLRTGRLAHAE